MAEKLNPKEAVSVPGFNGIPYVVNCRAGGVMTEVEDKMIQTILDLLNANGLTSRQAKQMLGRLHQLIDIGEMLAKKTAH